MLPIAKKFAEEMNVSHRVQFIDANSWDSTNGRTYDLIVVGHNELNNLGSAEEVSNLLQQISSSLKSTGRVVFFETVSGLGVSPYPEMSSVSMFVTRKQGKVRALSWYKDVISKSGFAVPTVHDLQPFPEKLLISNRNIITHTKSKNLKPENK